MGWPQLPPRGVGFPALESPNLNLPGRIIFTTTHFCALQISCDDHDGDDDDDDDDDDGDNDDDHLFLDTSASISYRHCFLAGICRSKCTMMMMMMLILMRMMLFPRSMVWTKQD